MLVRDLCYVWCEERKGKGRKEESKGKERKGKDWRGEEGRVKKKKRWEVMNFILN